MRRLLPIFILSLASSLRAAVWTGIDILQKDDYRALEGSRVGLITNHTGVNRKGVRTVDLLHDADSIQLVRIFSPEHGLGGDIGAGESVADGVDSRTGVPVFSLYGLAKSPTEEMFAGIDTLVYDIQDIGTRFYTYITTMAMALEKSAERKIRFVVLDRPNPIRGDILEGDILDADVKRLTGYFPIPTRYGMTVGELAAWWNVKAGLNADLTIIRMKNWDRAQWYDQTRLKFIPPSPNIPSLNAAILYPGIGSFEATNVSVGRGTKSPFEVVGAPWIDGKALCAHLRGKNFSGVVFEDTTFVPGADVDKGETCRGVRFLITDRNRIRPVEIFLSIFFYLNETYPDQFRPDWKEVHVVTGSRLLQESLHENVPLETLLEQYAKNREQFLKHIIPFHLYQ